MPIVLGVVAFGIHLSLTLDDRWPSEFGVVGLGIAAVLVLAVLGVFARTTAGIVAFWLMLAAVAGAVIYFVRGDAGDGFAMFGQAGLLYAVQFLFVNLRDRAGELPAPQHKEQLQLPEHELSARCYFSAITETGQTAQGDLGVLLLLRGDELLFISTRGTRTYLRADQLETWRDATGDHALKHADGLDPVAETLVLTGSVVVMKPDLFIQAEDIRSWKQRLAKVPVPEV